MPDRTAPRGLFVATAVPESTCGDRADGRTRTGRSQFGCAQPKCRRQFGRARLRASPLSMDRLGRLRIVEKRTLLPDSSFCGVRIGEIRAPIKEDERALQGGHLGAFAKRQRFEGRNAVLARAEAAVNPAGVPCVHSTARFPRGCVPRCGALRPTLPRSVALPTGQRPAALAADRAHLHAARPQLVAADRAAPRGLLVATPGSESTCGDRADGRTGAGHSQFGSTLPKCRRQFGRARPKCRRRSGRARPKCGPQAQAVSG